MFQLPPIPPPAPSYNHKPRMELTPGQLALYLDTLTQCGLVQLSAKTAGLSLVAIKKHRLSSDEFRIMEEDAKAEFRERLELEALRRGFEGYDEDVYHNGSVVGQQRRFDTTLTVQVLKRHIPEYTDRVSADVNVKGGVLLAPGTFPAEQWLQAFGTTSPQTEST